MFKHVGIHYMKKNLYIYVEYHHKLTFKKIKTEDKGGNKVNMNEKNLWKIKSE